MKQNEGESYIGYARRLTSALEDKTINYKQYGDLLLGVDNVYSTENIRKFYYCFKKFLKNLDDSAEITDIALAKELQEIKFETIKERKKIQTINIEYNKNAREEGRFELYLENIANAVKNLKPIEIKPITYKKEIGEKTGVIFISDAHYGRDVIMHGLFGEIINKYNPKEFETRMNSLLSKMVNDSYLLPVDKIDIIDCGDNIEGILRLGESLKNLKSGVVDSTIQYAEFMANWIIRCHNELNIPVTYTLTGGNHDILRLLESKANFEEETVAKFVYDHINLRVENSKLKSRLNNKQMFIEIEPYNEVAYKNYYGIGLLAHHGSGKNLKNDIEYYENHYQVGIDILVGGHLHSGYSETIGIGYIGDRELIRVPSICGDDIFSKNIKKGARAGARYIIFTEDGKDFEKTYHLN